MFYPVRLGVNIDHVATLRQVRGGTTSYPDLLNMVRLAAQGGAEQITIHLREDRRHIQLEDLKNLSHSSPLPINLEMAVNAEMLRLAKKYKPAWACFVPEKRAELTTEGGLNVKKQKSKIKAAIEKLQPLGIEISLFIEPDLKQIRAAFDVGADAVEFHTGQWVLLKGAKKEKEWQRLNKAAQVADSMGLSVHAGHGLDYEHAHKLKELPYLREVNIGHSLVCYALEYGMKDAVRRMVKILK